MLLFFSDCIDYGKIVIFIIMITNHDYWFAFGICFWIDKMIMYGYYKRPVWNHSNFVVCVENELYDRIPVQLLMMINNILANFYIPLHIIFTLQIVNQMGCLMSKKSQQLANNQQWTTTDKTYSWYDHFILQK